MILDDLYQEIILDHYKNPRNRGKLEKPDIHEHLKNPFCGDEIDLDVRLNENKTAIEEIRFSGKGCSISQASASMLTEFLKDKPIEEARRLVELFKKMLRGETTPEEEEELGELQAFKGVSKFPVRIKCATLVWNILEQGLNEFSRQNRSSETESKKT
jgi:nitrogen fixation NifU-like protein